MAAKKSAKDRGDFDRFTSDGHGLTVGKPDAAKKKVVDAYNKKQQKPKPVKRSGNKSTKKR